jgi:hypothetical protein
VLFFQKKSENLNIILKINWIWQTHLLKKLKMSSAAATTWDDDDEKVPTPAEQQPKDKMSSAAAATTWDDDDEKVPTPAKQQPKDKITLALSVGGGLYDKCSAEFAKSLQIATFGKNCPPFVALVIYMSLFQPIASAGGFDSTSIFDPSAMEYPWFLMTSAILALDLVRNHHLCARRSCGRRPLFHSADQVVSLTKFTESLFVRGTWIVTIAIQGISLRMPVAGQHKSGIFNMTMHSYKSRTGKVPAKSHKFHSLKQLLTRLKSFKGDVKDLKIWMYPDEYRGCTNGTEYRISLSRDCEKELVFTFFANQSGCRVSIHIRDLKMITDIFESTSEAANRNHVWRVENGMVKPRTSPPWMLTIDSQFTRHLRYNKLVKSTLLTYGVPSVIWEIINGYVRHKPSLFEQATATAMWDPSILLEVTKYMGYPGKMRQDNNEDSNSDGGDS